MENIKLPILKNVILFNLIKIESIKMALQSIKFSLPLRTEYSKHAFLNTYQREQSLKLPQIANNSHTNRDYNQTFLKNHKQKSLQNFQSGKAITTNKSFYSKKKMTQIQNLLCIKDQPDQQQIQKIKSLKNFSIHRFDIIGTYRVGRTIGKGSGSIVRSVKSWKGGAYAMKSYDKYNELDSYKKQNIQNQIKILELLNHKSILKYVQTISKADSLHIVTEYIENKSLRQWLKIYNQTDKNSTQYTNKLRKIFKQILQALAYMHQLDIAHRDIKLENILISPRDLQIQLIDFGFSLQGASQISSDFCGTPHYMAPQIISKRGFYSKPADIWATGVLLYKLATGSYPFKGSNDKLLFKKISRCELNFPEQFSTDIQRIIRKMINADHTKRSRAIQLLRDAWFTQQE